jgi:hypothetical protein
MKKENIAQGFLPKKSVCVGKREVDGAMRVASLLLSFSLLRSESRSRQRFLDEIRLRPLTLIKKAPKHTTYCYFSVLNAN